MVKITIDTSLINVRGRHGAMNILEKMHGQGKIELVGAQRLVDEVRPHPKQPEADHKVSTIRNISEPVVLGHSCFGSAYLAKDGGPQFDDIASILFPGRDPRSLCSNKSNDVMHMLGHSYSDSDYFLTDDKKDFIANGRRELLRARYGIVVMTPDEMVEHLNKGP